MISRQLVQEFHGFSDLWAMSTSSGQIPLPTLNLPTYEPKLEEREGKLWIFDGLRKKKLLLTPEEWVRQHWIHYLIHHLSYPSGLFAMERGLKYNKLLKRTDLVVWDREGKPYLLIECKAPKVKLTQKTVEQACLYNKQLQSPFIILSNGLQHICLNWIAEKQVFIQNKELPNPPK